MGILGRRVGVEKSSRNGILASIRPQSRLILLSVSPRRIPVFPSIKRTRLEWWFPVASVSCSTRSSRAEIAAEIAYSDGIVPIPVFYVHPSLSFSLNSTRRAKRRTRGGTVRRMSGEKREDGAFCRTTVVVHEWTRFHSETSMNERGGRMPRNGRECGSKGLIARITWIARARLDKVHLNRMELSDWYRGMNSGGRTGSLRKRLCFVWDPFGWFQLVEFLKSSRLIESFERWKYSFFLLLVEVR